jgi:carbon-monoxide dehydrogenase medium subunit
MKAAAFAYQKASSIGQLSESLAQGEDVIKLMAGGQSLGPMLNLRLARPSKLIDVSGLEELKQVHATKDEIVVGAAVTHAGIEDGLIAKSLGASTPLARMLAEVASDIAYRAVRNRGTIAGSIAHADPAADWVLALTTLNASVACSAPGGGRRLVPMTEFMQGAFTTALQEREFISALHIPMFSAAMRWGYFKFCRKTGEFAEASCCVVLDPQQRYARVVLGALGGAPAQLPEIARTVAERGAGAVSPASIEAAVQAAHRDGDLPSKRMAAAAVKRALAQLEQAR